MALEDFKEKLADRIRDARNKGISDKVLTEGLVNLGDIMMNFDKPATEEEALVKELWNVATSDEKRSLAKLVMRLAETR